MTMLCFYPQRGKKSVELSLSDWLDGIQKTVKASIKEAKDKESEGELPCSSRRACTSFMHMYRFHEPIFKKPEKEGVGRAHYPSPNLRPLSAPCRIEAFLIFLNEG